MAIGRAAKEARNRKLIIQPKLDKAILDDEYFKKFKKILNSKIENKFKMYIYNHKLLGGIEMTKEEWLDWIQTEREQKYL